MYFVACSGEYGPQISIKFLSYHFTFCSTRMTDRKLRRSKVAQVDDGSLFTFSLVRMVQILPKLLCMTIFCNFGFSKIISTKLTSIQIDEKARHPPASAVAGEKWSSSSTMRQVRTSARTGVHQKQMRVECFNAQRHQGIRKTLTLHLLLFLCERQ